MENYTAQNGRMEVELAPNGVAVRLGNTKYVSVGSMARRVAPEPGEIFEAGLVACAALTLQARLRLMGIPDDMGRLTARATASSPDGCLTLTVEVSPPLGFDADARDDLRREIIHACARYAHAECGFHVDVVFADPEALRAHPANKRRSNLQRSLVMKVRDH